MEPISRYLLTFLLNALWQVPLICAVAALGCRVMRNSPAGHRHFVWVTALAASLLLPLSSVPSSRQSPTIRIVPPIALQPTVLVAPPALATTPGASSAASSGPARTIDFGNTTAMLVTVAYLLFLAFRAAGFVWAWLRTVQIRRSAKPATTSPLIDSVWQRCFRAFRLRGVELLSSPTLRSPVALGAWRKSIIIPETLLLEPSEEVLMTAIGHEMAHLARRDFALNICYELLSLPLAFHPAARILRRGIERTREIACDELVTSSLLKPEVYARSIVSIAAVNVAMERPGYTLGVFDGDNLEERIRRLLHRPAANLKRARLLLLTGLSGLLVCVAVASSLALVARAQTGAREEMKTAGEAYNHGDFKTAIEHFENAARMDPTNIKVKLFLANALLRQAYAGGGEAPDSNLIAQARQQYNAVVAYDPRNEPAIQGMLTISIYTHQVAEAHDWALKLVQADPNNKTAYYSVGVTDWMLAYPEFIRARQGLGLAPDVYFIPDPELRKKLRLASLPYIQDGLKMLDRALQLDAKYSDAMAYVNLLDRLKAACADSPQESKALIAEADGMVQRALGTPKTGEPGEAQMQIDINGPPPGPAGPAGIVLAPPPPPPPPPPVRR